jgi:hypothetical protein
MHDNRVTIMSHEYKYFKSWEYGGKNQNAHGYKNFDAFALASRCYIRDITRLPAIFERGW